MWIAVVEPAGPKVLAARCREFHQARRFPEHESCREGMAVIQVRYLRKMINGVPVMTTPAEIDITTAEQLGAVLLAATENRYRTLVVDMTRTRYCDSAAAHSLVTARKRLLSDGGELRLVVPADGAVRRALTVLGVDRFIPCFASLEEAVAAAFDGAHR